MEGLSLTSCALIYYTLEGNLHTEEAKNLFDIKQGN